MLCSIYAKHYLFAEHIIYITCLFNIGSDLYQNLKNTVQDFEIRKFEMKTKESD